MGARFTQENPTTEIIYRWVPGNEAAEHWAKQGAMVQAASQSLRYVWSTTS
jgi:hypothetical protein